MLTGRYPSAIPLCSHPMGVAPQNAPWCAQIPDTMPTIPEVLALYGYDTVYATTQRRMTEHNQVAAQFQETLTVEMSGDQGLSSVVDSAIQWWGEHQDKPRFMVVHDSLEGALRSAAPPVHNQEIPTSVVGRILTVYHQVAIRRGELLGRLLQHLKDNETQRPLWVIVTSGHGTNLGETSGTPSLPLQLTHHDILLERTLHVPLVVFGPKSGHPKLQPSADTLVEPTIVELVDLMPTVTTLAQAATPANLPGKDLLAQLDGNANDGDSYAEFGDMLSLRSGQHLMMARLWMHGGTSMDPEITRRLKAAPNPGSTFLLHEVVGDPMQVSELVEQEPDVARQMYERMIEVRVGPGAPPGGGLSNEQVQALRNSGALNYW